MFHKMAQLRSDIHSDLTEYAIKLLHQNKVYTDVDFIQGDPRKLANITNLEYVRIIEIQVAVAKAFAPPIINGLSILRKSLKTVQIIRSGIDSLDELLVGGLMCGLMYEICGVSASGKTQLLTTIAVNVAQNYGIGTLYVDCKSDLSGQRIRQMLKARGQSSQEMHTTMDWIRVQYVSDAIDLVSLLEELQRSIEQFEENHRLLMIDSLPALWYLMHGDQTSQSKRLLAKTSTLLRRLMVQHNMVVLVVNLVTKWSDSSSCIGTPESFSSQSFSLDSSSSQSMPSGVEITTPALGKYWHSIPSIRLGIAKNDGAIRLTPYSSGQSNGDLTPQRNTATRTIFVLKSTMTRTNIDCTVTITDAGMV